MRIAFWTPFPEFPELIGQVIQSLQQVLKGRVHWASP